MANPKEWTLMFYFASDNPLAPNVVTQLKAITNAGFHQDVNVVAKFDPQTESTDTHVFDVNMVNKMIQTNMDGDQRYKFWGVNDPFIRNLVFDKLWSKGDDHDEEKLIRHQIAGALSQKFEGLHYNPPDPREFVDERIHKARAAEKARLAEKAGHAKKADDSDAQPTEGNPQEPGPKESLEDFLEFCAKSYPAKRYMLFLIGHGLIVGNDMFLFDANAKESSLSLKNLAAVLEKFTGPFGGKRLELLGFHSCSMSAIEVAYELRDTAKYMLASQGTEFIGSWPYREILIRVFNDQIAEEKHEESIRKANKHNKDHKDHKDHKETAQSRDERDRKVRCTIEKIFEYILRNSYDFQLAGYSFDLCLCDLEKVDQITSRLHDLADLMTTSLRTNVPFVKEAILLAHWDAQSYWQESYTDLYDFCWCLKRRCDAMSKASKQAADCLDPISTKCKPIINALSSEVTRGYSSNHDQRNGNGSIMRAAFAGPQYQYSHGLSVYFPWSEPANQFFWNTEYKERYSFRQTGWAEFLQTYFDLTMRKTVHDEIADELGKQADSQPNERELILDVITQRVFNAKGPMNHLSVPDRRDSKSGGGSSMDSKSGGGSSMDSKSGGGSSMDSKSGGGSSMDSKSGGGSSMDSKSGGGSSMDSKSGGGSSMDSKSGGGSSMDSKSGGGSSMAVDKPGGESSAGGDCNCPGIKNYPSFTRSSAMPESTPDGKLKTTEVKTASPDFYGILLDF